MLLSKAAVFMARTRIGPVYLRVGVGERDRPRDRHDVDDVRLGRVEGRGRCAVAIRVFA